MPVYSLPDLDYDYGSLAPHINGEIMELHHSKHHAAYVTGANTTLEKLEEARAKEEYGTLVGLEKTLAFNLSGHVLHSIFWNNLNPEGGDKPDGELATAIDEHFGSFDAFKAQLIQATTLVQGSGWGVLAWDPLGKKLIITQIYDHHGNVGMSSIPIFVIDAWEHAYYLQYKNVRADFVTAVWNLVNWADVAKRYNDAKTVTI